MLTDTEKYSMTENKHVYKCIGEIHDWINVSLHFHQIIVYRSVAPIL